MGHSSKAIMVLERIRQLHFLHWPSSLLGHPPHTPVRYPWFAGGAKTSYPCFFAHQCRAIDTTKCHAILIISFSFSNTRLESLGYPPPARQARSRRAGIQPT